MSNASTMKMTARQFVLLGDDPPGVRLELVDGEVAVSPSPVPGHSWADRMLTFFLLAHIRAKDAGGLMGDIDTVFGPHDVRRPDIVYFRKERVRLIHAKRPLDHAPDLCVEIISPSSRLIDRRDKFKQYAQAGIPHYWILDPESRSIEAYQLKDASYARVGAGSGNEVVSLPPFPDLQLPLGELWLPDEA